MAYFNITLIKGDGIGPEIVSQAVNVLNRTGEVFGHVFEYKEALMGGIAIDETGEPLPKETIETALSGDSVLLGSVGGPKWDGLTSKMKPESGLLGIRKAMGLYANIRPAVLYPSLRYACPLREDIAEKGIDMVVVRELTGGLYFGEKGVSEDGSYAYDTEIYKVDEIKRITRIAIDMAKKRKGVVHSIDKANVLESSGLWRKVVHEVADADGSVEVKDVLVDNAAQLLIKEPFMFDVILASNMFGDILSDEAAVLTGSLGMLPSASLGDSSIGLYEPSHGSAPDIAGRDIANPMATILSAALMFEYSLGLPAEAEAIKDAVNTVLNKGYRTADIYREGDIKVGCAEIGELIMSNICKK